MKNLSIGDVVRFTALADMVYVAPEAPADARTSIWYSPKFYNRELSTRELREPLYGVVSGMATRLTGRFDNGGYGEDYEGNTFTSNGTVRLWEVRTSWLGKPLLVTDEHISKSRKRFSLPKTTTRPRVKAIA